MDIEIINTDDSVKLRKNYLLKQFEITDIQDKINTKFRKLDPKTAHDNKKLVKELIDSVMDMSFVAGQSFGREKIIYKGVKGAINPEGEVYKERKDGYVGD